MPRQKPQCAKCFNHGQRIPLKGHRKLCRYNTCSCEACVIVDNSRKASKLRMKQRREQLFEEERKKTQPKSADLREVEMEQNNNSRIKGVHYCQDPFQSVSNLPSPTYFHLSTYDDRAAYKYYPVPQFVSPNTEKGQCSLLH